jgi:hypothetical protein
LSLRVFARNDNFYFLLIRIFYFLFYLTGSGKDNCLHLNLEHEKKMNFLLEKVVFTVTGKYDSFKIKKRGTLTLSVLEVLDYPY